MKKIIIVLAAGILTGSPGIVSAQGPVCQLRISTPSAEDPVSAQGDVVGTAQIPRNSFVWLLARRDDEPRNFVWPQQGIAATQLVPQTDGPPKLERSVHYGESYDVGKNFRVIAIVVDAATNQLLEKWRQEAPANNYRPWIGLPRSVEGCAPAEVVVKKVGH